MDKESQDSLPDELDELQIAEVDSKSVDSSESVDSNESSDTSTVIRSRPISDTNVVISQEETVEDKYEPCYSKEELEAINKFYQLKGKYEEIVRRKKQKIINNDSLSKREKKRMWSSEKIKCINCRKPVGTFFSVKNRRLLAQCGATFSQNVSDASIKPCKLNIDIQLASVTTMQETIKQFAEYKEKDKEEIIKTKLNLLFNFTTEEEAIKEFEKKRDEFDQDVATYNEYLELFIDIHNSSEKRERIRDLMRQKETLIQEIKSILKSKPIDDEEVNDLSQDTFKLARVTDAVNVQVGQLEDVLSQLKNMRYEYYDVVEDVDNPLEHRLETKEIITARSEVLIDKECKINKFEM